MLKRLIIFLICKRLGIKKFERFQFIEQKTHDIYWFIKDDVMKFEASTGRVRPSGISLHWLLDDNCRIVPYDGRTDIPWQ